jgi:hypothetical protein
MTAVTNSHDLKLQFFALPIKRKLVFLVIVSVVSIAMALGVVPLYKLATTVKSRVYETIGNHQYWLAKEGQIEAELNLFMGARKLEIAEDSSEIAAEIEKIAKSICPGYTFVEAGQGTLSQFATSRFRVIFVGITLPTLINFFEKMEIFGDNIAISETKIRTYADKNLEVSCMISVLHARTD